MSLLSFILSLSHPSLPPLSIPSIFIFPAIVVVVFSTLTFRPGLGQFMAGELSQRDAIQELFSNLTWVKLPSPDVLDELPLESTDRNLITHWGVPNVWVTLILFMIVRVSGRGGQERL
jgi:chloride channel 2